MLRISKFHFLKFRVDKRLLASKKTFDWHDYLNSFLFKETKNIKNVNLFENYLTKKLSVENLVSKLLEIDKLQFSLLNEEGLHNFKMINNPHILDRHCGNSRLKNLFKQFEFYEVKDRPSSAIYDLEYRGKAQKIKRLI
jgi:hypothetical protein